MHKMRRRSRSLVRWAPPWLSRPLPATAPFADLPSLGGAAGILSSFFDYYLALPYLLSTGCALSV
jgi:hypothetical protein